MTKPEIAHKTTTTFHPEALELAKRVHKEGQSKEEIKRMAQGISKGIELYKKQQSAKQRERDKTQKRLKKLKQEHQDPQVQQDEPESPITPWAALMSSGTVLMMLSIGFIFSGLKGWPIVIVDFHYSELSKYGVGVIFGSLGALNLYQAYTMHKYRSVGA